MSPIALILAGGKSSRFNSDKSLAHFNSTKYSNIQYLVKTVSPFVQTVFVTTNAQNYNYIKKELFLYKNVIIKADAISSSNIGPLAGIQSIFNYLNDPEINVLILPVDYQGIDAELIQFLTHHPMHFIQQNSRSHFTIGHLILKNDILIQFLNQKNYRLRDYLLKCGNTAISYPYKSPLLKNINYEEDLDERHE